MCWLCKICCKFVNKFVRKLSIIVPWVATTWWLLVAATLAQHSTYYDILRSKLISRYAMVCNLVHKTGLHLIMDMVIAHFWKYQLKGALQDIYTDLGPEKAVGNAAFGVGLLPSAPGGRRVDLTTKTRPV